MFRLSALLVLILLSGASQAHTPIVDADTIDWCLGTASYAPGGLRVEDSSATLSCGRCSLSADMACLVDADCWGDETCEDPGSKDEIVWWDNRTDAAVNDLRTLGVTEDATHLYFILELWNDPDPVMLPILQIGLDVVPGGEPAWFDPESALAHPGRCSVSTDRGCTDDADCHFCALSTEPPPSTRKRPCGSGCEPHDPDDVCVMTEVCVGAGTGGTAQNVGIGSNPIGLLDYLVVFDLGRYLVGIDSLALMQPIGGEWTLTYEAELVTNPGTGQPKQAVAEFRIPWSEFGPDFGPGQTFRVTAMSTRTTFDLDYAPEGEIEDVISEAVAGRTTDSTDSCPVGGLDATLCEIANGSSDGFFPPALPSRPGGRVQALTVKRDVGNQIRLEWSLSCSPADIDYAVYEGTIGSWPSHQPLPGLCSTGGEVTATFTPGAGGRFYLVVPGDGSEEGSYGLDGNGAERPTSTTACYPQVLDDACVTP